MRFAIAATLLLIATPILAKEFPPVGGYGFDWLQPETAVCHRITRKDSKLFRTCTFSASGYAFGIASSYHTCRISEQSELMIYQSQALCIEALETMQANAP